MSNINTIINWGNLIETGQIQEATSNEDYLLVGSFNAGKKNSSMATRTREYMIKVSDFLETVGTLQDLASVLAVGNTTGANNISINSGSNISFFSGLFFTRMSPNLLTGFHTLSLPDATGTIALTEQLPNISGTNRHFLQYNTTILPNGLIDSPLSIDTPGGFDPDYHILSWKPGDGTIGEDLATIQVENFAGTARWSMIANGSLQYNNASFVGSILIDINNPLTAIRDWDMPDASGTVALTNTLQTEMSFATSDATTPLVVATNIGGMFATHDMTINSVFAGVAIVGSGGGITDIDILVNGVSIFSGALTELTIDSGEATSLTAATQPSIANPVISRGDRISTNITTLTTGGTEAGLQIILNGLRT
tara:strand:- start:514 stop:1614 length:1101 start_codon:yes stop_codon:yes gene_type:complete